MSEAKQRSFILRFWLILLGVIASVMAGAALLMLLAG
jgi:hypothetical protein